ncbi:MAG: septum formation protein Maf [Planctomycetales bacterium]|nr:septum formation protein Maf [Planctomycetales bacterium]
MPETPIVLASQSPRRQELLRQAGIRFRVFIPNEQAEDAQRKGESTADFVTRLAYQKALDVRGRGGASATIIACDTVADVDGEILGKPRDVDDARRMLQLLSGREHKVYSGLCVWPSMALNPHQFVEVSVLRMTSLSPIELETYLASQAWQGKSGAFGYQDNHPWLSLISGTASNVVGLPMERLLEILS